MRNYIYHDECNIRIFFSLMSLLMWFFYGLTILICSKHFSSAKIDVFVGTDKVHYIVRILAKINLQDHTFFLLSVS